MIEKKNDSHIEQIYYFVPIFLFCCFGVIFFFIEINFAL